MKQYNTIKKKTSLSYRLKIGLWLTALIFMISQEGIGQVVAEHLQSREPADLKQVRISVDFNNTPLDQAILEIGKKGNLVFNYNARALPEGRQITYKGENITIEEVLEAILPPSISYVTVRNIVIFRDTKPEGLPDRKEEYQEEISGQVIDAETGEALPGVNVLVKGTSQGTTTNVNGNYSFNVPSLSDTLLFSFIGYQTQEVPINGRRTVDAALETQILTGEELVVIGYGSQRAEEVGSSIVTVNLEDLNPVATGSVNQMLRGKVAGLNLRQVTAQPGGAVSVNIRGDISPEGNSTPLYVIDGVPITNYSSSVPGLSEGQLGFDGGINRDPLSYLNPSDIESVTVLKDASATAIYGSSAANGVVLITTKSGRSGAIQVDYRGSYTAQTPHEYFPMLNARQFMQQQDRMAYDAWLFDNRIAPYGNTDPSSVSAYNPLFSESQMANAGAGTDWVDLVTESGFINEHNLALSGGSENTIVYASFNYQGTDGALKNSTLNRYAGRVNIDQYIGEHVHLNVRTTASRLAGNNASSGDNDGGQEKYNMLQAAYSYSPTVGVYNEDGSYTSSFHPLVMNPAAFFTIDDDSKTDHLFVAPNLAIDFSDNFAANIVGQVDVESTTRGFYLPRTTNNAQLPDGMAQKNQNRIENYTAEGYVTYQNDFEKSSLTVVAGAGYYKAQNEGFGLQAVGFFTDAFRYNNVSIATNIDQNTLNSWKSERIKLSQFARLNYSVLDRYIATLSFRRDGSSIFSENNKYGYFPGASVAWRISQEDFIESIPEISELKLRVGYGMAGNESVLQGNSLQLYKSGFSALIGDTQYNGVALAQVANPDLTWEKNYTFNLGLDFGFFRNRLRGSADYFVKTARDLLDFNPLPSNNAVGRVADNVGTTQSKGFEFSLHTQNIAGTTFQWNTDLNFSHYEAKWVERNPRIPLPNYEGELDIMDAIYGWETDGIIRSTDDIPAHQPDAFLGNVRYVDQNGDGELNEEDVIILGNETPRWSVGLNNTFSYKNFDLSVYLYGNFDFMRTNNYAPSTAAISQATNPENTTIYARDIWSVDNPNGIYPGVADDLYLGNNPADDTDFNYHDASFIRLSNISLSYSIPSTLFGPGNPLQRARIFVNIDDLGVITNYPGFDPEYTEPNPYPKSYSTTAGIELNF